MMNLAKIDHLLKSAQTTSEEAVEEYFDQIVNCIDQEKTQDAAKMIELVFAKGAADVRLIFYYFYAHFAEHGIKSFSETFPLIISLFNKYQNVLLPKIKIEKHIESSLNWYFSHLLLRLKYYEKMYASGQIHPIWKKSVLDLSSGDLEQLIKISEKLRNFFFEKWPKSPTKDKVTHLLKKMEGLRLMVQPSKPAEIIVEPMIEETLSDSNQNEGDNPQERRDEVSAGIVRYEEQKNLVFDPMDQNDISNKEIIAQRENLVTLSALEGIMDVPLLRTSINEFSRKLKAFEALISKNNYMKAGIVAQDLNRLIESFNPLNYFPKLFANYFSLLAKHVSSLSEQEIHKESMQVKALEKLYQTDLDMFIEW